MCVCVYTRVGGLIWVPEEGRGGDREEAVAQEMMHPTGLEEASGEEARGPGEPQMCSMMLSQSDEGRRSASRPFVG